MNKIQHFIDVIKNFPEEGKIWTLAIRKRMDKTLYDGNAEGFIIIPNSFRYWRADPFLFEHDGKTYLFSELFDRLTGKGKLGVALIKNGKCGKFRTCLNLQWHLSYPCVYKHNDDIYMVPECSRSGSVSVYKCIKFPYKWEKVKELCNYPGVDTTPIPITQNSERRFISTLHTENHNKNDNLYLLYDNGCQPMLLKENDYCARPAGSFFEIEETLYRPSQNCVKDYGSSLMINKVEKLDEEGIKETTILNVYPPAEKDCSDGVVIKLKDDKSYCFNGIHTYNISSEYEAIDLSYTVGKSLQYFLRKIYKRIIR